MEGIRMTSGNGVLFLGGSAPSAPPDPPVLPGVGRDGIGHRWHAAYAGYYNLAADDVTITGWRDAIASGSPDNLLRTVFEAGSPEPAYGVDIVAGQSIPYVRFAGIDLAGSLQLAPPRSLYVVFRTSVLLTMVTRMCGVSVSRASNGKVRAVFGGGITGLGPTVSNSDGWHSVIVNADTAAASVMIDGVYQSVGAYSSPAAGVTYTVHQTGDGSGGGTATADVRDHGTWPFGASADDMASVYAALKSQFPDLP
jgi:hypothetical protein